MKTYNILIIVITIILSSCNTSNPSGNTNNNIKNSDLVLEVTVSNTNIEVGYGSVYMCKIEDVINGNFQDTSITITLLSDDKLYNNVFANSMKNDYLLEIGFVKNKENEDYNMMPISGFVDNSKTSWIIVYVQATNE